MDTVVQVDCGVEVGEKYVVKDLVWYVVQLCRVGCCDCCGVYVVDEQGDFFEEIFYGQCGQQFFVFLYVDCVFVDDEEVVCFFVLGDHDFVGFVFYDGEFI